MLDVSVTASPIKDADGTVIGVSKVGRDITERKRAEVSLRASEEKYRSLFESSRDAIMTIEPPSWNFTSGNAAASELFGAKNEEEFISYGPADLSPERQPDGRASAEKAKQMIEVALREGTHFFEWTHRRVGGEEFPADVLMTRVHLGEKVIIQATVRDITERKRTEAELHDLRKAVEQSANTVVITDIRGNIRYVNPAFEKTTGYTVAETIGQNPRILKSGEQDAGFYRALWETSTSRKTWRGEFHNRRKDGTLYWELATISPVQDDKGELHHFIAIKEDITERKAMEASLSEALIAAEAGNRAKSEFFGIMSHELRTPLNGVLGSAELLTYTPLDEEQEALTATVNKCGEHLLAIVKDILDFSSMEAGKLAIEVAPMSIADLVKTAADTIRKTAVEKGLELRCETKPGVPHQITGDALRIRQILINLSGNAVKFTSSGSVVLRVAPAAEGRFLDFSVEDTGIGISPDTIGHLFKPFTQVDMTSTRTFGGTGLGLAISKRLAEAMGGTITVASILGRGSTFTFRLPLESAPVRAGEMPSVQSPALDRESTKPEQTEPPVQTGGTPGHLALVVEDDPENSTVAGKMLLSLGYRAEFAVNGVEAVKAFVPGKYFAILMDVVMPGMNGVEATKKIREIEATAGGHVPIIALTANVMPGDRDQYLAAGMDDFLSKPFKRAELATVLASVAQIS